MLFSAVSVDCAVFRLSGSSGADFFVASSQEWFPV